MTLDQFLIALRRHVAGVIDRAGVSPLDVLLAQARDVGVDAGEWDAFVTSALASENSAVPGFWTAIRLTIGKLGLESTHLAAQIETALTASAEEIESFDAYEGWRAFTEAGGYLTPKRVRALVSIRATRAPLWLDLAILAFQGDPAGLAVIVRELAEQGSIDAKDLRSRLSLLQSSLGQDHFLGAMSDVVRAFPDREVGNAVGEWLGEKMGTDIGVLVPAVRAAPVGGLGRTEESFKEAFKFAFGARSPKPILAMPL